MNPAMYKTLRESLGLTARDVAERAGVHLVTAQRWDVKTPPPPEVVKMLTKEWADWAILINKTVEKKRETIEKYGHPQSADLTRYRSDEQAAIAGVDMTARQHAALLGHIMMALTREGVTVDIDYRATEPPLDER